MLMLDCWKPVPGYEDAYEVSITGQVRNRSTRRILRQPADKRGYLRAGLWGASGRRTARAHRLVLLAFRGQPGDKRIECNHIDGVKHNNRLSNLEWVSSSENSKHACATGLQKSTQGENNGNALLTDEKARAIYTLAHLGDMSQAAIARCFSIDPRHVALIKNRKCWQHATTGLQGRAGRSGK